MIPEPDTAANVPPMPAGAKPYWKKFAARKCTAISTMAVSAGTASFHQVMALFTRSTSRMASRLMTLNAAISSAATITPFKVSVPAPGLTRPGAKLLA